MPLLEEVGLQFVAKDAAEFVRAINRGVQAQEQLNKATESAARAYKIAEQAGVSYNEKLKRFTDTQTNLIISQREAESRLARAAMGMQRAEQQAQQLGDRAEVSHYAMRRMASSMVMVTGAGGEMGSILSNLVGALGPLELVLGGVTGAFILAAKGQEEYVKRSELLINLAARQAQSVDELVQRIRAIEGRGFGLTARRGPTEGLADEVRAMRAVTAAERERAQGLGVLGDIQRENAEILRRRIEQQAREVSSYAELVPLVLEYRRATATTEEELQRFEKLTAANADELARLARELFNAARAQREFAANAPDLSRDFQDMTAFALRDLEMFNLAAERDARNAANAIASRLAEQLRDLQRQRAAQLESLASDHAARMADIERQGAARRADIARSFQRRMVELEQDLVRAREEAARDLAERLAEVEERAQEQRADIEQQFADRRAQIEQQYQERVQQVQRQYAEDIFEAEVQRDAKGIISARRRRDQQLRDAAQQRDKDNTDARRNYEKQQRDLADNLAKQKQQLQRDYERRVRDLNENFARQKAAAQQAYRQQQADLARALAEQRQAENASYAERRRQAEIAYRERRNQLIEALAQEKELAEKYGKAIIESLKGILKPEEIVDALKKFKDALNARIKIEIEPLQPSGGGGGGGNPRKYQFGGYSEREQWAMLHPREVVVPLAYPQRATELIQQYITPTIPLIGAARVGSGRLDVNVSGRVNVDGAALDAQVQVMVGNAIVKVIDDALQREYRR